jgi:hypothetical protein
MAPQVITDSDVASAPLIACRLRSVPLESPWFRIRRLCQKLMPIPVE